MITPYRLLGYVTQVALGVHTCTAGATCTFCAQGSPVQSYASGSSITSITALAIQ